MLARPDFAKALRGKTGLLGVAVLSLALFQAFFYEGYGNFHKEKTIIFAKSAFSIKVQKKRRMLAPFLQPNLKKIN